MMPEMGGIEATEIIRRNSNNVPIVALTADVYTENKEKCLLVGMNEVLTKPINEKKLQDILSIYC
jgi:CheY-like chemotaxis protein